MGKISGHTEGKGETMGVGNGKHSPSRMGYGMGETLMDRGGKGERPLGRGEENRSPQGPQWQWERPLGMQGVGGETMGGDDKHSPLKMGYGMEETPGPWGRERKPPGTTVAVGVTPNDGGGKRGEH